ncbi:SDR family NAD(P)-dependent oxidoreductase [Pseudorhodoferax sp. Leaf267]|uniref:SDR family NAD(P)-dependent oxidoreductase n=1 Tax=Pseudorhodoferax sp. Leaf267 TaxID=1736316 RepID=UPI0006F75C79|nr:SDR family oxidoreductase [Pseudorhodoferax sp. Leaf267]KQP11964.1 oxidoreductase [Pseudorhodoferax sp. Leaf267]
MSTQSATRKVCVVTGSSSGIGAATARLYAAQGWDVAINYSREPAPAEEVAQQCRDLGAEVLVVKADVSSDADCRRLAAQVQARWGRADVLVNNAGTTRFVPLKDLDGLQAEDFQRIYAVNVVGAYQMTRAFVPLLEQHPVAAVVNVSSIASFMGTGSSIAYMASKGALNAMTVGLARALGPKIRVNAIAPGLVDSPWLRNGLGEVAYEKAVDSYKQRAALADVITPEDIAQAAWWLGVGAAKTTGEVLLIDAGVRITRG